MLRLPLWSVHTWLRESRPGQQLASALLQPDRLHLPSSAAGMCGCRLHSTSRPPRRLPPAHCPQCLTTCCTSAKCTPRIREGADAQAAAKEGVCRQPSVLCCRLHSCSCLPAFKLLNHAAPLQPLHCSLVLTPPSFCSLPIEAHVFPLCTTLRGMSLHCVRVLVPPRRILFPAVRWHCLSLSNPLSLCTNQSPSATASLFHVAPCVVGTVMQATASSRQGRCNALLREQRSRAINRTAVQPLLLPVQVGAAGPPPWCCCALLRV